MATTTLRLTQSPPPVTVRSGTLVIVGNYTTNKLITATLYEGDPTSGLYHAMYNGNLVFSFQSVTEAKHNYVYERNFENLSLDATVVIDVNYTLYVDIESNPDKEEWQITKAIYMDQVYGGEIICNLTG